MGRIKGARHKKTEKWMDFVYYCMNGGLAKFQRELDKLEGKDYVNAFITLLEFHKPKLARTTFVGEEDSPINANIRWINDSTSKPETTAGD